MKTEAMLTDDQRRAIQFVLGRKAGALWCDVGTGKTVILLTALKQLLGSFDVRRILVVGPRLVSERVWHAECEEWDHLRGSLRVERCIGTPAQRLGALGRDAEIYTVTRDCLPWLRDQYIRREGKKWVQFKRFPFDTIVLDESQSFKSQGSERSKAVWQLRRLVERVYLATGSFIPNGHRDAWNQVRLLDGGERLGRTESEFLRTYFRQEMNDGFPTYTIREGAGKEIDEKIADVMLVLRDAQPPAPTNFIRVQLSKPELVKYRRMARTSVLELGGRETPITAVNAGVLYGKLLQLANGAIYDETHAWHEVHGQKLAALWELLESLPKPVIIGYGFRHDVERIFAGAPRSLGRLAVLSTGKSLDAWRRGDIDIGVMHPASAGHGLNDLYLSGAENLIWFGFTSNREFYDQLNGRLAGGHRRTNRKICIHHLMAEGTIDEDAKDLIDFKGLTQTEAQIRILDRTRRLLCPSGERMTRSSAAA
jgi:hypothetical protein